MCLWPTELCRVLIVIMTGKCFEPRTPTTFQVDAGGTEGDVRRADVEGLMVNESSCVCISSPLSVSGLLTYHAGDLALKSPPMMNLGMVMS